MLLRADLHTLFELGQLTVDPSALRVRLSERLATTRYEPMHGQVDVPGQASIRVGPDFLSTHAQGFVAQV